jgi:phosphatidylinositol dimannoside acyltransferase
MPAFRDRIADTAYQLGWSVVCRLPERWTAGIFRWVADVAWRRQGPRVQTLEGNLRRVLGPDADGPQLRALSRESMRSYARYWLEVFRLPVIPVERLVSGMQEEGEIETTLGYIKAGRGVIFALPHMGNWDQAGAWIIARGAGSFTTVMERLKPESVYERFVAFREGLGMEVLPASGGNSRFGVLAQRLRAGKVVCLPADRDVTGSGIEVDFFGEKARMMPGPAALAVQTGAALVPAVLWYTEDGWGVYLYPEIEVPADGDRKQKAAVMTQRLADVFAEGISKHPADWHMLQPVFTADLDQARLAAAEAAGTGLRPDAGEPVPTPDGGGQ